MASRDGTTCAVWLVFIAVLGPIVGEGPFSQPAQAERHEVGVRQRFGFLPAFSAK
jgi:hypothetical protein